MLHIHILLLLVLHYGTLGTCYNIELASSTEGPQLLVRSFASKCAFDLIERQVLSLGSSLSLSRLCLALAVYWVGLGSL